MKTENVKKKRTENKEDAWCNISAVTSILESQTPLTKIIVKIWVFLKSCAF